MSYEEKIACKRKKCAGTLTVPIKIIQKGSSAIVVSRCPSCHASFKTILSLENKDKWGPIVGKQFFVCDVCGTYNPDNWQYSGSGYGMSMWHPYWYWTNRQERLKITIQCRNCRKKRKKVISSELWSDIAKIVEKPPEKPPVELQCPHCRAPISEGAKVCPSCNKEIACSKCGAAIAPGAKFCSSCGDKVEKFEVPAVSAPPKENVCPTCNEEYDKGSIFCSVCGQEINCDKCGSEIQDGALFCTNCGDPVTKGDLST
ncbi:MAG: zinc ribbon domain-containing protein [Candidatus Helarchaeota archaeon]|nr:zinc ribbon domain-containing protein [Candidatus Helarchaeota archaeon]